MVAGLAARLKADPGDAAGWQKLIRAYVVLGDQAKARTALADARRAFAGRADALAVFGNGSEVSGALGVHRVGADLVPVVVAVLSTTIVM